MTKIENILKLDTEHNRKIEHTTTLSLKLTGPQ
jgi:hypothetical protein